MKKYKFKKIFLGILLFISIILILFSSISIISYLIDSYQTKKLIKNLSLETSIETNLPTEDIIDNYLENIEFLEVDFSNLITQNKDTVGWIQVIGTEINYPVVQTNDNEYYLTHSFNQKKNEAGWIFSDFRNNLDNLNYNSIIYGHGRFDGSMFGSLKNVLEEEWFQDRNNHIIKLSTPNENTIWQIFSVYTIYKESYYITTKFKSISSYQIFLDTILERSKFDFSTTVNTNDKILTLSTCKDNNGNRIVVHAKLIRKGTHSS